MRQPAHPIRQAIAFVLGSTLIFALVSTGWRIYRRLPQGEPIVWGRRAGQQTETRVVVRLRRLPTDGIAGTTVEFYPLDVEALRREFIAERSPGQKFEDFLAGRLKDRPPIVSKFDERGRTIAQVPPGKWWIHATLQGEVTWMWRLPVQISGRELTVELTPDNAYARSRTF